MLQLGGVVYPFLYELTQMYVNGVKTYYSANENYLDLFFLSTALGTVAMHMTLTPYIWQSKLILVINILISTHRTFKFLRIFQALSPIIIMIRNVFFDLLPFMTFYIILITLLSLIYGVLGIGNIKIPGKYQNEFNINKDKPSLPP